MTTTSEVPVREVDHDTSLKAHITKSIPLYYDDGEDEDLDRPPHVRAASGLARFRDHLVIVQDDVNFLAIVDINTQDVKSIPLPPVDGHRVFSEERGNIGQKLDLEAAVTVPDDSDDDLIAVGSGSYENREWVLRLDWDGTDSGVDLQEADEFFQSLRDRHDFKGAGLNIEGAVFVEDQTLRLFQRGNATPTDDLEPVDATGDVEWSSFRDYLDDPANVNPPELSNVVRYELGELDGIPLTFSDAEKVEDYVLFSASAESRTDDRIAGSSLGVIGNRVRMAELFDEDGTPFGGKIEGLQVPPEDKEHAYFVIDDDQEDKPSHLYEAELEGPWFND